MQSLLNLPLETGLAVLFLVLTLSVVVYYLRRNFEIKEITLAPPWLKMGRRKPTVREKVKHNLPQPNYVHFVGREKELDQINCILRPYPYSQHALITIDGVGGIGKSALALEVAHRHLRSIERLRVNERFEAIVWVSARKSVLTANGIIPRKQALHNLADIYSAITLTLGHNEMLTARPEEQREMVRRVLADHRTLLIIDNLETVDDQDVIDFLLELPAPTKAIVTTRHRIDVAYPIRLVGLAWEEARQLIGHECKKKSVVLADNETRLLYERTGGVPLAIVWSVALLGFGHRLETVLNRLGQPTSDIARFCFEKVMDSIRGESAYKLLAALSLFDECATRERLGYIANLTELDRDDGLVKLEKLSLVNREGRCFRMLPLTKEYVRAELENNRALRSYLVHRLNVVPFRDIMPPVSELQSKETVSGVRIPIGKKLNGELFEFVIGGIENTNSMISGISGSGKTHLIHVLLMNIALHYPSSELRIWILAPKGADYRCLAPIPHIDVMLDSFFSILDYENAIHNLEIEVKRRFDLFRETSSTSFQEFRSTRHGILPRILVVVDEITEVEGASTTDQLFGPLSRVMRIARAPGVHFLIASQTPLSIPYQIHIQISSKLVLRTSHEEARQLLGEYWSIATDLKPGEAIFQSSGELERLRVAYLDPLEQEECISLIRQIEEMRR